MKSATTAEPARKRRYEMSARADAAANTAERILDAAAKIFWESPTATFSLDQVAARAGVSVQTVIRRFGGRDGLFSAAAEREAERIAEQRAAAPVGDAQGAIAVLVDHYEEHGANVLRLLAEEQKIPQLAELVVRGREFHRAWCARVFAPDLAGLSGAQRRRRLAQFTAVCDVQTWKLLRIDSGLSRPQTELALVELLQPLLKEL
jgi:AcrR family transcriptional regulator